MASKLAQVQYGDLPALVSPTPSIHPDHTYVAGQHCAVATIPLADLADWVAEHNLRPVRPIGSYWPPMIYYEEIDHAD